jgi:hypothetical protein
MSEQCTFAQANTLHPITHRSKNRDSVPDLAPVLWFSYGTMAALLEEIISIYPALSPPELSGHASNRVYVFLHFTSCSALIDGVRHVASCSWIAS